ncbi:probable E3 ubiquitin-protein ligase DTX2 isoform X2 [Orbicella faveolata]|uniref:probable E3 ubiquitin-protein ligase DTX2 isoform X2 n=1 Tax=Orbicella faveolata TaxID=48498 RepID=UPI0009E26364|nr:probable E3 ubiquitin-protein ligase DTX2 isoform X2 [Orbicella faveolata]
MASSSKPSGVVVWEWEERPGLWIPYEVDVVRFLEESYLKRRVSRNSTVNLGQSNPKLNYYEVDLVNMEQLNVRSGMLRKVQRKVYSSNSVPGQGVRWEWYCDVRWMAYDIPTSEVIEKQNSSGSGGVLDLTNTPVAIPNVLNFPLMVQINKHTGFQRRVQRLTGQRYPSNAKTPNVAGASPKRGHVISSTHNGRMVSGHTKAKSTATPRKDTKPASIVKKTKKAKVEHAQGATGGDPLSEFCNDLEKAPDEVHVL